VPCPYGLIFESAARVPGDDVSRISNSRLERLLWAATSLTGFSP
jgi:hypothetical protein